MPELNKKDLESLLRPKLGKDLVVESFTSKRLTVPGENYGSTMLAIDAVVKQGNETSSQSLSLVAKLVPPTEFLWKIFDPPTTFCKEINCYLALKEEFKKIQIEKKVPKDKFCDVFPECYGARTTMSEKIGDRADKNAVLLLENLKTANYGLGNRRLGFDLKHAQLVVIHLARFHALSIAVKMLKPQVFENIFAKMWEPHFTNFGKEEMLDNNKNLLNNIKNIPGCEKYVERIKQVSEKDLQLHADRTFKKPNEPYAAFCHADFWVNNIMIRHDPSNSNTPTDVKFVDFQILHYDSPVKDLIFFLYSSVVGDIRAKHYDDLVRLYHDNLTDCLKDLGCDVSPFTFQLFLDEIEEFAPTEAYHILFMMTGICAKEADVPEMEGLSFDQMLNNVNDVFQRRVKEIIVDLSERGWL